jgi:hypothetical protein
MWSITEGEEKEKVKEKEKETTRWLRGNHHGLLAAVAVALK